MRAITSGKDGESRPAAAAKPPSAASAAAEAMAAMAAAAALLDSLGPTVTSTPAAPVAPAIPSTPSPAAAAAAAAASAAVAAGSAGSGDAASRKDKAQAPAEPEIDLALAYGPDDPGYGPPGPDWYKHAEQQRADEAGYQRVDEGEALSVRGPFEPLRSSESGAEYVPGEPIPDAAGAYPQTPAHEPLNAQAPGTTGTTQTPGAPGYEEPDDQAPGVLGDIRKLYRTAETVGPDSSFDDLLERQRQLISDFFKESAPADSDDAAEADPTDAQAEGPAPVPLGFETAQSLAWLRGELRGTS